MKETSALPFRRTPRPVGVLILYRDAEHARLGQSYCSWLTSSLQREQPLTIAEWKFDTVWFPAMKELARLDAELAEMLVISTRADEDLPAHIKELAKGPSTSGFRLTVILLTSVPAHAPPMRRDYAFLDQQARGTRNVLVIYSNGEPTEDEFDFDRTSSRQVVGVKELTSDWNEAAFLADREPDDLLEPAHQAENQ